MQSSDRDDSDPRTSVIDAAPAPGDAADDVQPAVLHPAGTTDVRERLLARMQALLTEIDQCEPGEEEWW